MKRLIGIFLILAALLIVGKPVAAVDVQAEAAMAIDADTGQVLYGKNIDTDYTPGNFTKLFAAYTALGTGALTDNLIVLESTLEKLGGKNVLGLKAGDRISVDNALYAMVVGSANDAALVVAENLGGGVDGFIEKMNETASLLGAGHTHFRNATGAEISGQITSARDLTAFLQTAVKNSDFLRYLTTANTEIPAVGSSGSAHQVSTGHKMVNGTIDFAAVTGGMTAKTDGALFSSVNYIVSGERRFICVTMKSPDEDTMYQDIQTISNHVLNDWKQVTLSEMEVRSYLPEAAKGKKIIFEENNAFSIPASIGVGDLSSLVSVNENQYFRGSIAFSLKDDPEFISDIATINFFEASPKNPGFPWASVGIGVLIVVVVLALALFIFRTVMLRRQKRLAIHKKKKPPAADRYHDEFCDPAGASEQMPRGKETPGRKRSARTPRQAEAPKKEKSNRAFYESRYKKKKS